MRSAIKDVFEALIAILLQQPGLESSACESLRNAQTESIPKYKRHVDGKPACGMSVQSASSCDSDPLLHLISRNLLSYDNIQSKYELSSVFIYYCNKILEIALVIKVWSRLALSLPLKHGLNN